MSSNPQTCSTAPLDPLAKPPPPRVLLSEAVSRFLDGTDETSFTIVARDTYPGNPSRWAISLHPITREAWQGISGILHGTHRAVRIKAAKAPQPTAACNPSRDAPDAPQGNVVPISDGTGTGPTCHQTHTQPSFLQ